MRFVPLNALAILVGILASPLGAEEPQPNILLITVDTLRPDALGWVAGQNDTPAIDRLALEGFAFPAAIAPVPLTLPSHTTIHSGLLPRRHGVRDNGQIVREEIPLLAEILAQRGYQTGAFVGGFPLLRRFGLDRGFQHYDDDLTEGEEGWLERPAESMIPLALSWVRQTQSPWFLWLHFYDPHDPYDPGRAFWRPGPRGAYDGEVGEVDVAIEELVAGLGPEPRLTVFAADHGESLGEHGEGTHGYFIYDSTLQVPVIFHGQPWIPKGRSELPVRLQDIAPTILDLVGMKSAVPPDLDGTTLVPLLQGKIFSESPALLETHQPWISYGWAPLKAIRTSQWKLIVAPKAELYHLASDPKETHNLFDQKRRDARALLKDLRTLEAKPEVHSTSLDDPETLEKLSALGYLGSSRTSEEIPRGLADPKDKTDLRDLLAQGETLLRSGRFPESIDSFQKVLQKEPNNRFANLRLGMAYIKAEQLASAIPFLEKSVILDPNQAEAHYALAYALTGVQRFEEAEKSWVETIRLQPRREAAWSNLGTVLGQMNKLERAREAFQQALSLDPHNWQLQSNLGFLEQKLGHRPQALALFEKAARESKGDRFTFWPSLGLLRAGEGQLDEAMKAFENAVEGDFEYPESRFAMARILISRKIASNAKKALQEAIRLKPSLREIADQDPSLKELLD